MSIARPYFLLSKILIFLVFAYGSQFEYILNHAYNEGMIQRPIAITSAKGFRTSLFISPLKIRHIFFMPHKLLNSSIFFHRAKVPIVGEIIPSEILIVKFTHLSFSLCIPKYFAIHLKNIPHVNFRSILK